MYPPFVLKSQKIEKFGDFYSYQVLFLFMPDPKYLYQNPPFILTGPELFLPGPLRIPTGHYFYFYRIRFIHAGSKFIKSLLTIPESSNIVN